MANEFKVKNGLIVSGSADFEQDLRVRGTLTVDEFHTSITTSSIIYESGSTRFGNSLDDIHGLTGSVNITGSISLNGQAIGTGKLDETVFNTYTSSYKVSTSSFNALTGSYNSFTTSYISDSSSFNSRIGGLETFSSSLDASFVNEVEFGTFSSSIKNFTGSLNSYTNSLENRLFVIETSTSSLNTHTSSTNSRLTSIENTTSSLNSFTSSTTPKLSTIETSIGSLNTFTSSINTTIKNKLNTDGVISGSSQILSNSNIVSSSAQVTAYGFAITGSNTFKGDQLVSGSIIPTIDNAFDLGSPTSQWRDVYISSGSLYIDNTKVLSSTAQELVITTDTGQSIKILEGTTDSIILQTADGDIELKSSADGDILLDPTNGKIMLKGPIEVLNGNKIQSSIGGTPVVFASDIVVSGSIDITGTIEGIDLTAFSSSLNSRLGNLESSGGSLNTFTASAISRLNSIESSTSSLNTHTSSTNTRLSTIETSTGSLNTFTSSINTTIKNRLNSEGVISGSGQIDITQTTNYTTFSSSLATTDLNQTNKISAIESTTGSLNTFTSSANSRLNSIETSTSSINTFTSSANSRLSSIEISTSSLNSYTSSANTKFSSIESVTSSFASYSGSTNTRLNSIETSTGSLNSFTSSANTRLSSIETSTSSLNSFTSSINTTIKNRLNTEGVISGSAQVTLSNTTGYSTFSSSLATTDAGQDTRLTSLEGKTGSYATTGSNIFIGNQTITGSLYVSQDLIIAGSSSIQHISSSVVNIADNIITVNAQNPSIRFGGLAVIDSGSSPQVSGSMLFDSTNDQWIFVHQNQSQVTSSILLMGPQTFNNLGNETYPTTNRILKSVNAEHLGDSNISDTGAKVSINSNTEITGSLISTGNVTTNTNLVSNYSAGDEGGEISLNKPVTNTTINSGITIDVWRDRLRIFESGGTNRGGFFNIAGLSAGVGTNFQANADTASFVEYANVANKPTLVSGSSQINHNATTNYDANQHVDHTAVSITAGNGLSGGGTIAATRTLTLDTGSTHFTNGVKSKMNTDGVVSGSSQITYSGLSGIPSGIVSGSSQITYSGLSGIPSGIISGSVQVDLTATTNYVSGIKTRLNTENVLSSSAQVVSALPAGTVSGSSQVLNGTTIHSGAFFNGISVVSGSGQISFGGITGVPSGLVSGSSQVSYTGLSNVPSGIVSGSSQITYGSISGIPSGIVSGSSQVSFPSLSNIPGGLVSGSSQIDLTATTNYSSGIKTRLNAESVLSSSAQVVSSLPAGTVSGSAQITFGSISSVPSGLVSGSSQISISSTTGFGTYLDQGVLTTSSPTFSKVTVNGAGNPLLVTNSASAETYAWITNTKADAQYSYLRLTTASGDGYIIKNRSTANSVGSSSLYLWNSDSMIEFVPSGNTANRTTIATNGDMTVRGNFSATNFSGSSSGTNTGDQTNISGNAATATLASNSSGLEGLTINQIFNNRGRNHGSPTDFDSVTVFGPYFIQGTTNGPGTGSSQFYGISLGLGNEYAYSQYAMQMAIPRYNSTDRYISYRTRENTTWGSWNKIWAGYADTANTATSATTAGNITAYTINQNVGTGNSPTFVGLTLSSSLNSSNNATFKNDGSTSFALRVDSASSVIDNDIRLAKGGTDYGAIQTAGGSTHDFEFYVNNGTTWYRMFYMKRDASGSVFDTGSLTINGVIALGSTSSYFVGNSTHGYRFNNQADSLNLFTIRDNGELRVHQAVTVDAPTSNMKISASGIIFGGNNNGRETNSAQISAGYHQANSLNLVGMSSGTGSSDRRIDMWVEGGLHLLGSMLPKANSTYNLGSSSMRWNTVFTSDLSMSNGIGDYTIVEGEEDLFIYNNKTNKVFKFLLQEVDPAIAPPKKV